MSSQDQTTRAQGTAVDESLQTADLLDTARTLPEISDFMNALQRAGLEYELRSPDLRTLFAPINGSTVSENEIRRHIVRGRQTEADLRTAPALQTVAGEALQVQYDPAGSVVGGAKILHADIACLNGHIHIIEAPVH